MRCHPKRQWRGINPPPNHRVASAVSLSKQLNQRSPSSVSLSEEEFNIASYLLMLSYATPSSSKHMIFLLRSSDTSGCSLDLMLGL
ncbi:BnaCnng69910D [Brassica napus]|uniref:BnaCnng69910D protein n=1 Tax=Brassica napus TaxID=3708 RepID=A0A078JVM0_BRANA|nr:BnaCnng69910D [Brassica napus]